MEQIASQLCSPPHFLLPPLRGEETKRQGGCATYGFRKLGRDRLLREWDSSPGSAFKAIADDSKWKQMMSTRLSKCMIHTVVFWSRLFTKIYDRFECRSWEGFFRDSLYIFCGRRIYVVPYGMQISQVRGERSCDQREGGWQWMVRKRVDWRGEMGLLYGCIEDGRLEDAPNLCMEFKAAANSLRLITNACTKCWRLENCTGLG